jgi:ABC-type transport system substrate-binding protein
MDSDQMADAEGFGQHYAVRPHAALDQVVRPFTSLGLTGDAGHHQVAAEAYVTAVNAPAVKQDRNLALLEGDNVYFGMTLAQYVPNASKAPFNDKRVRQAINLVIDRDELLNSVIFGLGTIAGPIPPAMKPWAIPVSYTVDVERAKQLMREAGYPNGFKTTAKASPLYPPTSPTASSSRTTSSGSESRSTSSSSSGVSS